jgi:AcrR family transcriptional regulator
MEWDSLLQQVINRPRRDRGHRQARSKRTQEQILNAALRVFARNGLSRARIADVAADAGIPTSTLYEYYDSKESLAYDVPISHLTKFYAEFAEAVTGTVSPCERILLYLSMSCDFARRHPEWASLFYLEIWPSVLVKETELGESVGDFARILIFLVNQAIESGELPQGPDPYQTTSILLGSVNQLVITWLLYRRPRNLTKAGADMATRVLGLLKSEARKTRTSRARNGEASRSIAKDAKGVGGQELQTSS